jgi:phosphoglycerate-specific signal transduction histidine kinase
MTSIYGINDNKGNRIDLHDIDGYQRAMQKIRNIKNRINSLEESVEPKSIKDMARDLSRAVNEVNDILYSAVVDKDKKEKAFSRKNDYKTDFEEMKNIPRYFE